MDDSFLAEATDLGRILDELEENESPQIQEVDEDNPEVVPEDQTSLSDSSNLSAIYMGDGIREQSYPSFSPPSYSAVLAEDRAAHQTTSHRSQELSELQQGDQTTSSEEHMKHRLCKQIPRPGLHKPRLVPDKESPACTKCGVAFSFTRRRHHCHACGQVFCNTCCKEKSKLEYMEFAEARVCMRCYAAILQDEGDDINQLVQKYVNLLKTKKYDEAKTTKQQLSRSFESQPVVTAEDLEAEATKYRNDGKYLEAILYFSITADFYVKKNPDSDVAISVFGCAGEIRITIVRLMKNSSNLFSKIRNRKIVRNHVIPLMLDMIQQIRDLQINEEIRCEKEAWCWGNIEWCQHYIGDL